MNTSTKEKKEKIDFDAMSPEQREEYERSALKLQALQRGRAARAKVKELRDKGADKETIRKILEAIIIKENGGLYLSDNDFETAWELV